MSSIFTSTTLSSTRPRRGRKGALIASIVVILVVAVVVVIVLYFLNVLVPRYKCDAETGKCGGKYNGSYKNNTCNNECGNGAAVVPAVVPAAASSTVTKLASLKDMSATLSNERADDTATFRINYLVKLGEFTVDAAACIVNIDAGYQVGIFDGNANDGMVASLLVISKDLWDADPAHPDLTKSWGVDQNGNIVLSTTDTDNTFNVLALDHVVVAGQVSKSTTIADSGFPKITSDNTFHDVTLKGNFNLPSGSYWVIAFLGVSTTDTIKVRNLGTSTNTVTVPRKCAV